MSMTADEVLARVAELPREDWVKIQTGIADLIAAEFSAGEIASIRNALAEADAEFARGESFDRDEIRRRLGLP